MGKSGLPQVCLANTWEDKPELALASMPVEILVKIMSDAIPSHRLLCTQQTKESETGSYLATRWVDKWVAGLLIEVLNKKIHAVVTPILLARRRVIHPTMLRVFQIETLIAMAEEKLDEEEITTKCNQMRFCREEPQSPPRAHISYRERIRNEIRASMPAPTNPRVLGWRAFGNDSSG
jgi:hypothetical protein